MRDFEDLLVLEDPFVNAEFYIMGEKLDGPKISSMLGIDGSITCDSGKKYWRIDTGYEETMFLYGKLEEMMNKIKNKADEIKEIDRIFNAECGFNVIVDCRGQGSQIMISCEMEFINFAAEIGASLDIKVL